MAIITIPCILQLTVCEAYYLAMYREIGDLNPYAVDYPVCTEDASTNAGKARKYGRGQRTWMLNYMLPTLFHNLLTSDNGKETTLSADSEARLAEIKSAVGLQPIEEYQPCAEVCPKNIYMTSLVSVLPYGVSLTLWV